jgi:hypothetical protein
MSKEYLTDSERYLAAITVKNLNGPRDVPAPRGPRRLCDKKKKDLDLEILCVLGEALEGEDEEAGTTTISMTTMTDLAEAWLVLMRDRGNVLEWHTWNTVEEELDK